MNPRGLVLVSPNLVHPKVSGGGGLILKLVLFMWHNQLGSHQYRRQPFLLVCTFSINLKQEIRTNPLIFKETKRATKANHQKRKLESDNQRKLAALLRSEQVNFVVVHPSALIQNCPFWSLTKLFVFFFPYEVIPNSNPWRTISVSSVLNCTFLRHVEQRNKGKPAMRKTKKVYIIYKAQRLLMSTDACMGGVRCRLSPVCRRRADVSISCFSVACM